LQRKEGNSRELIMIRE